MARSLACMRYPQAPLLTGTGTGAGTEQSDYAHVSGAPACVSLDGLSFAVLAATLPLLRISDATVLAGQWQTGRRTD